MLATAIVGTGPGGTGPLVFAAQNGVLDAWLEMGVALIDRAKTFGGTIGRYAVNSDTLGNVYLECLEPPAARKHFAALRAEPVTRTIRSHARGFPPLPLVGQYFNQFGRVLLKAVTAHPRSMFLGGTTASALRLRTDGSLAIATNSCGKDGTVAARTAVLALGGRPARVRTSIDGLKPDRMMSSDVLLTQSGLSRAASLLAGARRPRVLILGGSHSAYSAAWAFLNLVPQLQFGKGAITIVCRRDPKIFYPTRADAQADRYPFEEDDICRRTQRVNRLAGLRGDGRELWRAMTSRPGTVSESRVRTLRCGSFESMEGDLVRAAYDADLIVTAFGYAPRTIPIYDATGRRLALRADDGGPAVDDDARIILQNGRVLPNVFAIGLGSGYRPHGPMGGEPSFRGQANSLWLYQNDIGGKVYAGVQNYLAASGHAARSDLLAAEAK